MTLTPQMFMPLPAGPELDRLVRRWVLGSESKGKAPAYSSSREHALSLLTSLPLSVGHMPEDHPQWSEARPFNASFTVGPAGNRESFTVTAHSPELALCKAALLYVCETADTKPEEAVADAPARED